MAIELGPNNGTLKLFTTRAGMAAKAGHDLDILVERWSASLDPAAGALTATIDATSLRVLDGHGGVKALSDSDRADIAKTIGEKVLKTGQHREISFASTNASGLGSASGTVAGQLTLVGTSGPITIAVAARESGDEVTLTGSSEIVQSQFGIKPYSAMMGALKVADSVRVEAEITVPKAALAG